MTQIIISKNFFYLFIVNLLCCNCFFVFNIGNKNFKIIRKNPKNNPQGTVDAIDNVSNPLKNDNLFMLEDFITNCTQTLIFQLNYIRRALYNMIYFLILSNNENSSTIVKNTIDKNNNFNTNGTLFLIYDKYINEFSSSEQELIKIVQYEIKQIYNDFINFQLEVLDTLLDKFHGIFNEEWVNNNKFFLREFFLRDILFAKMTIIRSILSSLIANENFDQDIKKILNYDVNEKLLNNSPRMTVENMPIIENVTNLLLDERNNSLLYSSGLKHLNIKKNLKLLKKIQILMIKVLSIPDDSEIQNLINENTKISRDFNEIYYDLCNEYIDFLSDINIKYKINVDKSFINSKNKVFLISSIKLLENTMGSKLNDSEKQLINKIKLRLLNLIKNVGKTIENFLITFNRIFNTYFKNNKSKNQKFFIAKVFEGMVALESITMNVIFSFVHMDDLDKDNKTLKLLNIETRTKFLAINNKEFIKNIKNNMNNPLIKDLYKGLDLDVYLNNGNILVEIMDDCENALKFI